MHYSMRSRGGGLAWMLIALAKNMHIDTETKYTYDYIQKNCNFNGRRVTRSSCDPLRFPEERKGKVLPTLLCCYILVRVLSISQELLSIGYFTPLCRLQHSCSELDIDTKYHSYSH